ncbi:MAG TPA: NfeD family protein [Hyphomicrobiaceae bacterium]|nr:NfeD family protein [Hyphomicrobiaceae bacterium]
MQAFYDLMIGYTPWLWIAIAVLLIAFETFVPGLHFAFFGIGAFVVGVSLLVGWYGFGLQLLAFGVVSLVAIAIGRPFYNKKQESDAPLLNERGQEYIGRIVRVEERITGGRGRVRLGDTVWTAEGPELPVGAEAKITGVNGTVLIVTRA